MQIAILFVFALEEGSTTKVKTIHILWQHIIIRDEKHQISYNIYLSSFLLKRGNSDVIVILNEVKSNMGLRRAKQYKISFIVLNAFLE